jgi:hypothetical protein
MTDPSSNSPVRSTSEQYRKLLRGEITSEQYVREVRKQVSATRKVAKGPASTRRRDGHAAA